MTDSLTNRVPALDQRVRMDGEDCRPGLAGDPSRIPDDVHDQTLPVGRGRLPDLGRPRPAPGETPDNAAGEAGPSADTPGGDLPDTVPPAADGPPPGGPTGPAESTGPGSEGGTPRRPWWRRPAVLGPAAAATVLAGAYGIDLLVAGDSVPRHTVVSGVDIGGLSRAAAAQTLQRELAPRLEATRAVVAGDVSTTLSPAGAGLRLDVPATVAAAARQPHTPWTRLTRLFTDRAVPPVLSHDAAALTATIDAIAGQVDRTQVEATISLDGTTPTVVPPADGRALDRTAAAATIRATVARPGAAIRLPVQVRHPHVLAAEAERVLAATVRPALAAPVTVASRDGRHEAEVPVPAIAAALTFTPRDTGTLEVSLDPAKLQSALGDGFTAFGTPAKDATFAVSGDSISVVPSVDGTGIDPATLARQLLPVLSAPAPRTVTAQLGPVHAAFTTEQAQALGIHEKVSSFTTHFANTASGTNIRVVAAKVNGAVLKPGETFSLNTFTGPRGTAQGYVPAAVISGGKFTQAVGGGISQFATTMFNAVFFAGLQDIHHQPHSYYISRYPAGREATVYEGQIDLVWRNDSDTGIYVQTTWVPGSITVSFWGTKHYEIRSISGDRVNVTQPAVQTVSDDGTCKAQAGQQGFDITVTRVFADLRTGAELRRQNFHTHYNAEPVIHCIPPVTGAPSGPPPGPDTTEPEPIPSP